MMKAKSCLGSLFSIILFAGSFCYAANHASISSPDGNVTMQLNIKEKLEPNPSGKRLYYSVQYQRKDILLDSPFGLEFQNMEPMAQDLQVIDLEKVTFDDNWERVWGRRKKVRNHFNELTVHLKESNAPNRRIDFIVRAYNDGVAFRYAFPRQSILSEFTLTTENSYFKFPGNLECWAADFKGFATHQEEEFPKSTVNQLTTTGIYGCPLLVKINSDLWISMTEADLTDWAGLYFHHAGQRNTLVSELSPYYDNPSICVKAKTPAESPWRVIMMGDQPGDFLETDMLHNLNDPCAIEDPSWIEPGKSAWDRWWCGDYLPDVDFKIGMNDETMKYFIDFAAEMVWEYQLVDWLWYGPPFHPEKGNRFMHPDADLTKQIPEVDIPGLVKYANKKGVKIIIWLEWMAVDKQMDEAFALYEKWGVDGVKIDFMARDDQYMVNFYHRCVKKAAEHHLLVDFHGGYKPTGWSRTYPNLITREGVLGNEYNKWSDRITPEHCLTLPFTRGTLGEMDFTPGGFRQKKQKEFKIVGGDAPGPFVMGTRCFQLAMMVVYESALQVMCDSPYNYRSSPAGLDFLKKVPTTWDDTKVIHGEVGDLITVARRSGDTWFVGSMTDTTARTLEIPLSFLGKGKYDAEIWMGADEADDYPDRLTKEKITVRSKDVLKAKMVAEGGHVVVLKPVK